MTGLSKRFRPPVHQLSENHVPIYKNKPVPLPVFRANVRKGQPFRIMLHLYGQWDVSFEVHLYSDIRRRAYKGKAFVIFAYICTLLLLKTFVIISLNNFVVIFSVTTFSVNKQYDKTNKVNEIKENKAKFYALNVWKKVN